jgi:hypothetical protein
MYGCICTHKFASPVVNQLTDKTYHVNLPDKAKPSSIFPCSMEVIIVLVDKLNELQAEINALQQK